MACSHPRLKTHTFSNGTVLKMCPDCPRFDEGRKETLREKPERAPLVKRTEGTAAERAWEDLQQGIKTENSVLAYRGFAGLRTICRKATIGLTVSDGDVVFVKPHSHPSDRPISDGGSPHTDGITLEIIMEALSGQKNHNMRYIGNLVRNRKVSEIRKSSAKKRRQPRMVHSSDEVRLSETDPQLHVTNHCEKCGSGFEAIREDAKFCSQACQKAAKRRELKRLKGVRDNCE